MSRNNRDRLDTWLLEGWPKFLIYAGLALFWLACMASSRLPVETVFIGPGVMLAGVLMLEWNKHETR